MVEHIKVAQADLLFVAISSPEKEHFLGRYQAEMRIPFAMSVGGTLDVATGKVSVRMWIQKSGLEWFHHLLQDRDVCSSVTSLTIWFFCIAGTGICCKAQGGGGAN